MLCMAWEDINLSVSLEESLRQVEAAIDTIRTESNLQTTKKGWAGSPEGIKVQMLMRLSIDLKSAIKELKENGM